MGLCRLGSQTTLARPSGAFDCIKGWFSARLPCGFLWHVDRCSAQRPVESVARNFGDSRYLDKKVRMIQTTDFHRRCDRKGFPEELLADVTRTHELLNVCRVVHERNNVAHLATHARENGRYVFKDLANLSAHISSANDLTGLIESNLALQMNNLPVALNHGHRESAKW
jgi:hypothetical protein